MDAAIQDAVGILTGTDDGHNLGILLNARALNSKLLCIVRQNRHKNEVVFDAADADMIMQPSLVTARRILLLLIAPLVKPFFRFLLEPIPGWEEFIQEVIAAAAEKLSRLQRQPAMSFCAAPEARTAGSCSSGARLAFLELPAGGYWRRRATGRENTTFSSMP